MIKTRSSNFVRSSLLCALIFCACMIDNNYAATICVRGQGDIPVYVCKDIADNQLKVIQEDSNGNILVQNINTKQKAVLSPKIIFEPIKWFD